MTLHVTYCTASALLTTAVSRKAHGPIKSAKSTRDNSKVVMDNSGIKSTLFQREGTKNKPRDVYTYSFFLQSR